MALPLSTFDEVLAKMRPDRIREAEGCLLWPEHDLPNPAAIHRVLAQLRSNYAAVGIPPDKLVARARSAYERDFNRRFVAAETDYHASARWTPADLAAGAHHWASRLRALLPTHFPGYPITVETIGLDGLDDEPLEVAVTFFQPWE